MAKKNIKETFDFLLKDFSSNPNPKIEKTSNELVSGISHRNDFIISLSDELKIKHPYIIYIIFVILKDFWWIGRWEKTAWEIPIKYKDVDFILTHRKFGFRIISNENEESVKKGLEAMAQIHKTIPYAEELYKPHIKAILQKNHISLENKYYIILNRYKYFKDKTVYTFRMADKYKNEKIKQNSIQDVFQLINKNRRKISVGNYYLIAMVDSFFSLLEHIFVLLIPFIPNFDITSIKLDEVIGMRWKNKFRIIFSDTKDNDSNKNLENLVKIKEIFKNTISHGHFLKRDNSFFAQTEYLGLIPVILTEHQDTLNYSLGSINQMSFKEIMDSFNNFIKYLKNHKKTKYGMKYIESGLPVAFDDDSIKSYNDAMKNYKSFDNLLRHMSYLHDKAANMDW